MFEPMRLGVVLQIGICGYQGIAQFLIDLYFAERRPPGARFHDREGRTETGVIGTKNNVSSGEINARIDGARDVSRVHITRMRNDEADGLYGVLNGSNVTLHRFSEFIEISGVETARNCRFPNHGTDY